MEVLIKIDVYIDIDRCYVDKWSSHFLLFPLVLHRTLYLGSSSFSLSWERREINDGRAEFQRYTAKSGAAPKPGLIQRAVGERVSFYIRVCDVFKVVV